MRRLPVDYRYLSTTNFKLARYTGLNKYRPDREIISQFPIDTPILNSMVAYKKAYLFVLSQCRSLSTAMNKPFIEIYSIVEDKWL